MSFFYYFRYLVDPTLQKNIKQHLRMYDCAHIRHKTKIHCNCNSCYCDDPKNPIFFRTIVYKFINSKQQQTSSQRQEVKKNQKGKATTTKNVWKCFSVIPFCMSLQQLLKNGIKNIGCSEFTTNELNVSSRRWNVNLPYKHSNMKRNILNFEDSTATTSNVKRPQYNNFCEQSF